MPIPAASPRGIGLERCQSRAAQCRFERFAAEDTVDGWEAAGYQTNTGFDYGPINTASD